jgi:multimeric flavodoxin WrbA
MDVSTVAINCSLKPSSGEPSSTDKMIGLLVSELKKHGVAFTETIRLADYDIKPGVESDEGGGDEWPEIRRRILAADILIFGTPIWLGQMSSIAKRVLERMDAFLSETDANGRMPSFGKVAVAAIVGNEDGAHNVTASVFQALNDEGWTIPAGAANYWVGEAMQTTDFKDLPQVPDAVAEGAAIACVQRSALSDALEGQSLSRRPPDQLGTTHHWIRNGSHGSHIASADPTSAFHPKQTLRPKNRCPTAPRSCSTLRDGAPAIHPCSVPRAP